MLSGHPPFYGKCGTDCGWERGENCKSCQVNSCQEASRVIIFVDRHSNGKLEVQSVIRGGEGLSYVGPISLALLDSPSPSPLNAWHTDHVTMFHGFKCSFTRLQHYQYFFELCFAIKLGDANEEDTGGTIWFSSKGKATVISWKETYQKLSSIAPFYWHNFRKTWETVVTFPNKGNRQVWKWKLGHLRGDFLRKLIS